MKTRERTYAAQSIIALVTIALIANSAKLASAGLVGHWKFDEGAAAATAIDSTGGTNGTVNGATTGVAGIAGNAYSYDGSNDYVDMGSAAFIPGLAGTDLSFSYWLNTADTDNDRHVAVFLGDDSVSDEYIDSGIENGGEIYGRDRDGGSINEITDGTTAVVGEWNHVVYVVKDAGGHDLYVNGTLEATNVGSRNLTVADGIDNFEIGRLGRSSPTDYFEGLIDDVQVYDMVLTEDDVTFLFNNPGVARSVGVPEPSTMILATIGLVGLAGTRRRRRRG
ncbi:MAG: PEP-CTERM sorting domain-containing protein [Pirellulales bacterium]|nr:PEP-CTERM sorting domain-containing protein [Pirellulales bacterium]